MWLKRFSNIESTEDNPKKILDTVSGIHGAAAAGSLGYGAYKLGQVGTSIYKDTKKKKTKLGKALKLKDSLRRTLKMSGRSFKEMDVGEGVANDRINKINQEVKDVNKKRSDLIDKIKGYENKEISEETYNKLKSEVGHLNKKVEEVNKKSKRVVSGMNSYKKTLKNARNLKKAKIAGGVALATGAVSLGTHLTSKHLKKEELQKKFSIESGSPDNKGSLKRELIHKLKVGAVKGSIAGGSLGITVGGTIGAMLKDIKLAGKISLAGLSSGALIGALYKMSEAMRANGNLKKVEKVGMNEVLDYLEESIIKDNNKGYGIKGNNLISRYLSLDGDPKVFDLNIALKDGVGILTVKKGIEEKVNLELEKMIENNRLADYTSEPIKGGWAVKLIVPSVKALANFIYNLCYQHHLRINVITQTSQKLFSEKEKRKLPQSRIGIGWLQEKLGKNDSEKYFKRGQDAADKSYDEGDDDETIVKKSKRAAGNKVILDKSGRPILEGAAVGGVGYLAAKSPRLIENLAGMKGINIKVPESVKNITSKHSGKIALGAGLIAAGRHVPRIYEQQKAARTGMDINTRDRIKKKNKKK